MITKYTAGQAANRATIATGCAAVVLALMTYVISKVEAANLVQTKIYFDSETCEGTPTVLSWDGVTGLCMHTSSSESVKYKCIVAEVFDSTDCSGTVKEEDVFGNGCEVYLAGHSQIQECLTVPNHKVGTIQLGDSCSEDGTQVQQFTSQSVFMLDICQQNGESQYTMYTLSEDETSVNQAYSSNADCSEPELVLTFPIGACEIRNDLRNVVGDVAVRVIPAVDGAVLSHTASPTYAPTPVINGVDAVLRRVYQESDTCSRDPISVSWLGPTNQCIQTSATKSALYDCTSSRKFNSIDCTGTPVVEEFEEECGTFVSGYSIVGECVTAPAHRLGLFQMGESCVGEDGINADGVLPFLLDFCQRAEHQYMMYTLSEDETTVDQIYSFNPDCSDPELVLTFPVGPCEIRGDLPHVFADYAVRVIPALEGSTLSHSPPVTKSPTMSPSESPTSTTQHPTTEPPTSNPTGTDGTSNAVTSSSVGALAIGVTFAVSVLAVFFE